MVGQWKHTCLPPLRSEFKFLASPHVGKLVVAYCWSALHSTEPWPTVCTGFLCPSNYLSKYSIGMGDRFGALLMYLMAVWLTLVDWNPFWPCFSYKQHKKYELVHFALFSEVYIKLFKRQFYISFFYSQGRKNLKILFMTDICGNTL